MSELWDAYGKEFHKLDGLTLVRGEPIEAGVYHLVCEIAVKHKDGTYLLMQRDLKKHKGGMWELTAGGSALKGESAIEGARRELLEETGIDSKDLVEIGRVVYDEHHSYYVEYLCVTDCDKESIVLQEGETIGYKWVDEQTLLKSVKKLATTRILQFLKLHTVIRIYGGVRYD